MSTYAGANTTAQWFQSRFPGATLELTPRTMVVVVHTTEGLNWPGYEGGGTAPNYTGKPPLRLRIGRWRAHFPDEKSSRALKNLQGGVETNTLNALQIELIGTCDPKNRKSWEGRGKYLAGRDYVYWPDATDKQLRFVSKLLADLSKRHGLQLVAPRKFVAYPESAGTNNGVRMSGVQWRHAVGVVGHQHVPENVHGDPGNINMRRIIAYGVQFRGGAVPASAPTSRGPRIDHAIDDLQDAVGSGQRGALIRAALLTLKQIKPFK